MIFNRDVGQLQGIAERPAAQTAAVAYARPATPKVSPGLSELLVGLGGLSQSVAQMGQALITADRVKKDDPRERQNSYARAGLEAAKLGNDPDQIMKLHGASSGESDSFKTGLSIAAANSYANKKRDEWQTLTASGAAGSIDWNAQLQQAVLDGEKAGYFPTDEAKQEFLTNAAHTIETLKVGDRDRQNNETLYGDAKALATQTSTSFTAALEKDGAPAAQKVLAGLWADPRYAKLPTEQRDRAVLATISGIVQSGNVRAFTALEGVDGPDGIPLKTMPGISENWGIWAQKVKDNADSLHPEVGAQADKDAAGKSTTEILGMLQGAAGDYVRQKHLAFSAGQAFATDVVTDINARMAKDGTTTVDLDKELAAAMKKGTELGIFSDAQPDASAAFHQSFNQQTAALRAAQTNAKNSDTRNQTMDEIAKAAQSRFATALTQGGPAAATEALRTFAVENKVLRDIGYDEQVKLFTDMAQGFVNAGNLKAVEAIGNLPVGDKGGTVATANQKQWAAWIEGTKTNADQMARAERKPILDEMFGKATNGKLGEEDIKILQDKGATNAEIASIRDENARTVAGYAKQELAAVEARNKTMLTEDMRHSDAALLMGGRGDRIKDYSKPLAPGTGSEKTLTLTEKERWDNAMEEVDRTARLRYNAKQQKDRKPVDPKERDAFARDEVLQTYARNGRLDEQTKRTLTGFLGKIQVDGYSVTADDLDQLQELRHAASIYAPSLLEDVVGGGQSEAMYKGLMLGLEAGLPPQAAIQQARNIRDRPWNERPLPSEDAVNSAVSTAMKSIGATQFMDGMSDLDLTDDPDMAAQVEAIIRKNARYATSMTVATEAAVAEVQKSYVRVNDRMVRFTDFGTSPATAQAVLKWATEQYQTAHSAKLQGEVFYDNGPNGTLMVFDKTTGLPLSHTRLKFSDLAEAYEKEAGPERLKKDQADAAEAARLGQMRIDNRKSHLPYLGGP